MKQITIDDLIPLLKKGWVAMDKNGAWCWYRRKPRCFLSDSEWGGDCGDYHYIGEQYLKTIEPVIDWKQSLRRIK